MANLIPAKHALIGAITTPIKRISAVRRIVVLDVRNMDPNGFRLHPEWKACHLKHGACFTDWMELGDRTMTPEGVFGEWAISLGFVDSSALEQAFAAFARIEECAWARAMVPSQPLQSPAWTLTPRTDAG